MFPNIKQLLITIFDATPIGRVDMYAGIIDTDHPLPRGWLLCDGSEVSKTTYAGLHAVIGNQYGTPTNSSNFKLPDMQGRFPVGVGTLTGTNDSYALNSKGGSATVALQTANMPAHTHGSKSLVGTFNSRKWTTGALLSGATGIVTIENSSSTGNSTANYGSSIAQHEVTIDATHEHDSVGNGTAHENRPPYIGMNFIIYAGK